MTDLIRSLRQYGHVEAADAIESLLADKARLEEALRLIKLACLGTSEADGWTAKRVIHCTTRICIDAGIGAPYHELGTEQRYLAITRPTSEIGNRVDYALNKSQNNAG